jgi:hypothetical protein
MFAHSVVLLLTRAAAVGLLCSSSPLLHCCRCGVFSAIQALVADMVAVNEGGEQSLPRIVAAGGRFGLIKGVRYFMVGLQPLSQAFHAAFDEEFAYSKSEVRFGECGNLHFAGATPLCSLCVLPCT